jgi:hypothetical protein
MIGTVATSLVEKDEALVAQQRIDLPESDVAGRAAHLFDELIASAHNISPRRFSSP